MKKSNVFLRLLIFIVVLMIFPIRVLALPWTNFPATDAADDVYYYPEGTGTKGEKGDYKDFIDILEVNISGDDIVIKFQAGDPINRSTVFGYGGYDLVIEFDIDDEIFEDYHIIYFDNNFGYYFEKWNKSQVVLGGFTWNGTSWISGLEGITSLPFIDVNDTLTLQTVGTAINQDGHTLTNIKFNMQSQYYKGYITLELEYVDYLPESKSNAILGFPITLLLISIVSMISLISIYNFKNK